MTKLGVNIDHSATLRQARYANTDFNSGIIVEPNILEIAFLAEKGGADSITVHLREDRRHICDRDVKLLRNSLKTKLNMEMACTDEMIDRALEYKPDYVCIVPENRLEVTTEGGLDVITNFKKVENAVRILQKANIKVSLFIDPEETQIIESKRAGADMVELHTGAYANAWGNALSIKKEKDRLRAACDTCNFVGLTVNAGHGLNYANILDFMGIASFNELNIGHSIICRSLIVGIEQAVSKMKEMIS